MPRVTSTARYVFTLEYSEQPLKHYSNLQVVGPSGTEDDCYTSAIDADIYSVRFVPRENGLHHIHVKFNGVHIAGSPFILKVGKDDSDPACVIAAGPGLQKAVTGMFTRKLFSCSSNFNSVF